MKTEEERKEAKRLYMKQYYEANREKRLEQRKQYCKNNAEKIAEYKKRYRKENKERELERQKQYFKTPMGRASRLVQAYKREDKKYNRGKCTLTAQWIVDNIFTRKCVYCGESDWTKLGCDRIDNSKPHTEDNVVCSCWDCNRKRGTKSFEEFFSQL